MTTPMTSGYWPAPQPRRRWLLPTLVVLVVALAGALAAVILTRQGADGSATPAATTSGPTPLRQAATYCRGQEGYGGVVQDSGRSLKYDMEGEDSGSGDGTYDGLKCVLERLETPDYVVNLMVSTRALDGRQTETWGEFEASWTYHPDDGLDVAIRMI